MASPERTQAGARLRDDGDRNADTRRRSADDAARDDTDGSAVSGSDTASRIAARPGAG